MSEEPTALLRLGGIAGPRAQNARRHAGGVRSASAVEDARHGHQRLKIEEYGNSLFAVLHMTEQRDGEFRVGELDVFVGQNYVLTVRSHAEQGLHEVRERCEREPEFAAPRLRLCMHCSMQSSIDISS
jgi:magnesium transporter